MTKTTLLKALAAVASGLMVLACNKTVEVELSLSDKAANFEANGTLEKTVKVTCNSTWKASCAEAWVSVSPTSGEGDGDLKITVQENTGFTDRTAEVKVTAGDKNATVKVTQLALVPTLQATPDTKDPLAAEGGTIQVTVTSNAPWSVTIPSEAGWITASKTSGEGDGAFTLAVAENPNLQDRSADIKVTAQDKSVTFTVKQHSLVPSLAVTPETLEPFGTQGGAVTVQVSANVAWTVSISPENADWIATSANAGEKDGSFVINVAENTGFEERGATVTIQAEGQVKELAVTQAALTPAFSISPETIGLQDYTGGSVEVTITANVPWTVSVPAEAAWITPDVTSGEGNGKVVLSIAANIARQARSANVSFAGQIGGIEKVLAVSQDLVPIGHVADSLALVAIYNAADGANWKEERRWDLSKSIDTWDGVKLTEGRVTQLAVTAKDVMPTSWTLPKEIGDLTELKVLKFNQCNLTGEIPEEVFTLTHLTDLYFQSNSLNGTFSDKYTQLTELKNLYINGNKDLKGALPASIGNMTKLESINIAQTNFSGAIPQELARCTALKNLMAWGNGLSGEIPDIWDQLPNIGVLQFYDNPGITGPIPASIGSLKKATGIQLKNCNLTGNIPATFGGLEKCGNLQLNGNRLSGVVPAEVQAHPKFLPDSGWKYEINILPQQEGYGLSLKSGSGGQDLDDPVDVDPWQ